MLSNDEKTNLYKEVISVIHKGVTSKIIVEDDISNMHKNLNILSEKIGEYDIIQAIKSIKFLAVNYDISKEVNDLITEYKNVTKICYKRIDELKKDPEFKLRII